MGIFDEMYALQVIAPRLDFIPSQIEARMRALELEKEFRGRDHREVLKEKFGDCNIFDYINEGRIECCQDGTCKFEVSGRLPTYWEFMSARARKGCEVARTIPPEWFAPKGPKIKEVYFNGRSTTVLWMDGTKTTVTAQAGIEVDEYAGVCAALAKKLMGTAEVKKLLKSDKVHRQKAKKKKKKGEKSDE